LRGLELRNKGLSYGEIRRILRDEIGYTPPKSTVSDWLNGRKTPIGKIRVFDVYKPEVGLILSMVLSDGNERFKRHQLEYKIRFYNTNIDYIEIFKKAFEKLGFSTYIRRKRRRRTAFDKGEWRLSVDSALLYLLLKHYDKYVAGAPDEAGKVLLKGLWLGDGHIGRGVFFYNTDLKLTRTVSKLLRRFEVKHSIQGPYKPHPLGKNQGTKCM